jgi:hypothetical protein
MNEKDTITKRIPPNPYDWTREVVNPELFTGRLEELKLIDKEISNFAQNGLMTTLAVIGPRRVGKSSLLRRTIEICESNKVIPIRIDLSILTASDVSTFWDEFFKKLERFCTEQDIKKPTIGFTNNKGKIIHGIKDMNLHGISPEIIINNINLIYEEALKCKYNGILLIIDEAHYFQRIQSKSASPVIIKQSIKQIVRDCKLQVMFFGEPDLAEALNDIAEPLYGQGRIILLKNFKTTGEVIKCALQPLYSEYHCLISPMTIEYLTRLSQGKPNQIRLICKAIYDRFVANKQFDLNITINILDDLMNEIGAGFEAEPDLAEKVDKIRRLNSTELEILYNMNRYPSWRMNDIIDLDESFRSETVSESARQRRKDALDYWKKHFVSNNLMLDIPDVFALAGTEFLYLYLRFWYEIDKFGELSKGLLLGDAPHTLFTEKVEKCITALAWKIHEGPAIRRFVFHPNDRDGCDRIINRVRSRFAFIDSLRKGEKVNNTQETMEMFFEYLSTIEVVKESGLFYLLCLSIRNLETPCEAMQIELYFKSSEIQKCPLSVIIDLMNKQQASDAKLLLEGFIILPVELMDLANFLKMVGIPTLDSLFDKTKMDTISKWHMSSIQYYLHIPEKEVTEDEIDSKWISLYEANKKNEAVDYLAYKISNVSKGYLSARYHNDLGYISTGLNIKNKELNFAQKELQTAFDLHYKYLNLTLLNLAFVNILQEKYDDAEHLIKDVLFITFLPGEIEVGYLRTILPKCSFPLQVIFGHTPANVIETAYINLAYINFMRYGVLQSFEILEEGLSILPSSYRIKQAEARYYLADKKAFMANPIYVELNDNTALDSSLRNDVDRYIMLFPKLKKMKH